MKYMNALNNLAPKMDRDLKDTFMKFGPSIFDKYQINTPLRIAHFLSQMHHESMGFTHLRELRSDQSAEAKYGHNTRVGYNLGNTRPGDGAKYKGRGIIQLTGRYNYSVYGQLIGVDLLFHPERAEDSMLALKIACAYWHSKHLNELADKDDVRGITKKINGGYNGLLDRIHWLNKYKQEMK